MDPVLQVFADAQAWVLDSASDLAVIAASIVTFLVAIKFVRWAKGAA